MSSSRAPVTSTGVPTSNFSPIGIVQVTSRPIDSVSEMPRSLKLMRMDPHSSRGAAFPSL